MSKDQRPEPLPPSRPGQNYSEKTSNEAIKFVAWAIGIGAGSTFMIITYAWATFTTKEVSAANQRYLEQKISTLESAVVEIKGSNKEFQNWLRDNWSKRKPEGP